MREHLSKILLTGLVVVGLYISRPQDSLLPTVKGAINPDITQENISQNICNPNWSTKSIRPTSSYTTKLKVKQIKDLGYKNTQTKDFEEDHLISLELGGHPTDPNNLWPQSYLTKPNARDKDRLENALHTMVCSGKITLQEAQREVSTDWIKYWNQYGLNKSGVVSGVSNSDDE